MNKYTTCLSSLMFGAVVMITVATAEAYAGRQDGVVLGSTRLILTPSKRTVPLSIYNGTERAWLTQVRVLDTGEHESPLFTALPPLFRLEAGSDAQVRVLATGQPETYPFDREGIWYVHVLTIPASAYPGKEEEAVSSLRVSFESVIKLFWRPASLKAPTAKEYRLVTFTRAGGKVRGCNLTRYYQSFGYLEFDGHRVDLNLQPSMLAPLACETFSTTGQQVRWAMINDYGGSSEIFSVRVSDDSVTK